jgi:threonine dehydrogenase-like Zn-dependent dehydrogenase
MRAVAVKPGTKDSIHLREAPTPTVTEVPDGRGVLVKVLRVGVDGTDREINSAEYGAAPPGDDYLIIGHESLGIVQEVGPSVTDLRPGDLVTAMVRRPGTSIYDEIGLQDVTTDDVYMERGINLLHGYLAEYYVDADRYIVPIPKQLEHVGVLMEPTSVAQKAIREAYEIQRRLRVWKPLRAAVLGTGSLGLLATLFLRLRGIEVVAIGRNERPYHNADLLDEIGAHYVSTTQTSLKDAADQYGPFDIMFEGTGYSPLVFEAMDVLGKNGVLIMVSVTGGSRTITVPSDHINQGFVLGNKVAVGSVNASRADFEQGVTDLCTAEITYPGWLSKLLTTPINGLESFQQIIDALTNDKSAIKVYCEVG